MTFQSYISGAVCGPIWWPVGQICGRPVSAALRQGPGRNEWERHGCATFAEACDAVLMNEGGDFQGCKFTADTLLIVRMTSGDGRSKRTIEKTFELSKLPGCAEYVDSDHYACDFDA
jgi:hypothetical protein